MLLRYAIHVLTAFFKKEGSTFQDSHVGSDMKAPQNEQNNALVPPELQIDEQVHSNQVQVLENMVKPIVFIVKRRQDTIRVALNFVKFIITVYLLFAALPYAILESFPEAPCKLPIVSRYSPHCTRELKHPRRPIFNPDFITLARLQSRLEYVMEDSASSSVVSVDIKESEMALRDLGTLVRHSSLDNKVALARDLKLFVEDAKTASSSLQQFGTRVWGAVDKIVSGNEHAIAILESISLEASAKSSGSIFGFSLSVEQDTTPTYREQLEDLWLQEIQLLEKTVRKLIQEAQANVGSLERLEERLHMIQDMTVPEEEKLRVEERAFKRLWFPDEEKQQSNSASLKLLQMVQDNRKQALNHVSGVLFKLEQMSNDLGDLREGVATPIIIARSSNIPIEAHIRNIRSVTDRLVNQQTRMREIEDNYRRKKFSD
ncbi:hypothetical protein OPQ81_007912 [Rhizoctonia solani]|nr:hypothetical protein OPQ81_007912 [Rhizoctonia solani]